MQIPAQYFFICAATILYTNITSIIAFPLAKVANFIWFSTDKTKSPGERSEEIKEIITAHVNEWYSLLSSKSPEETIKGLHIDWLSTIPAGLITLGCAVALIILFRYRNILEGFFYPIKWCACYFDKIVKLQNFEEPTFGARPNAADGTPEETRRQAHALACILGIPNLKVKLMKQARRLPGKEADAAIVEYIRYMKLVLLRPQSEYTPCYAVEQVWQLHASHTCLYEAFCHGQFGRVIPYHFTPSPSALPQAQTYAALKDLFPEEEGWRQKFSTLFLPSIQKRLWTSKEIILPTIEKYYNSAINACDHLYAANKAFLILLFFCSIPLSAYGSWNFYLYSSLLFTVCINYHKDIWSVRRILKINKSKDAQHLELHNEIINNTPLWKGIEDSSFFHHSQDKDSFLIQKLCATYNWSHRFAQGAILEYQRFMYLMMLPKVINLIPSYTVANVWILHASCTEDYEQLFKDINQPFLPYDPEANSHLSKIELEKRYDYTLALYHSNLGMESPDCYWPKNIKDCKSHHYGKEMTSEMIGKNLTSSDNKHPINKTTIALKGIAIFNFMKTLLLTIATNEPTISIEYFKVIAQDLK